MKRKQMLSIGLVFLLLLNGCGNSKADSKTNNDPSKETLEDRALKKKEQENADREKVKELINKIKTDTENEIINNGGDWRKIQNGVHALAEIKSVRFYLSDEEFHDFACAEVAYQLYGLEEVTRFKVNLSGNLSEELKEKEIAKKVEYSTKALLNMNDYSTLFGEGPSTTIQNYIYQIGVERYGSVENWETVGQEEYAKIKQDEEWKENEKSRVEPTVGMSMEQVRESTWGEAKIEDQSTVSTKYGKDAFWYYPNGRMIHFRDGKVISIVK